MKWLSNQYALIFASLVTLPSKLSAQDIHPTQPPGTIESIPSLVQRLYEFGIEIAGVIFVIIFLVGSIQYLTSSGDADGTKKAKSMMIDAIVGLILVLAAWAISKYVLNAFQG